MAPANTFPSLSAGVLISSGTVNSAKISDLQEANRFVKVAHADKDLKLIFSLVPLTSLRWVTFSDSSWANRHDGSSQGGAIHLLADSSILNGQNPWASIIDWKSWKLKRITKPSLAGEAQAFSEAQDRQEWLRSFWPEIFSYSGLDLKHVDSQLLADNPSIPITDCKSFLMLLPTLSHPDSNLQSSVVHLSATVASRD